MDYVVNSDLWLYWNIKRTRWVFTAHWMKFYSLVKNFIQQTEGSSSEFLVCFMWLPMQRNTKATLKRDRKTKASSLCSLCLHESFELRYWLFFASAYTHRRHTHPQSKLDPTKETQELQSIDLQCTNNVDCDSFVDNVFINISALVHIDMIIDAVNFVIEIRASGGCGQAVWSALCGCLRKLVKQLLEKMSCCFLCVLVLSSNNVRIVVTKVFETKIEERKKNRK